ncbi:MAG TPA: prepilin-type N-terminal cleavage/methylation domain-containing protein [Candidatus Angelobacter sp.]
MKKRTKARGFTLVELLIAIAMTMVVVGAAVKLFTDGSNISQTGIARADVQQIARGSLAVITRDLGQASIGIPQAGIALPSGAGSTGKALFACSAVQCYIPAPNNQYPNDLLPPVMPGQGKGANGTDVITVSYLDNTWPVNNQTATKIAVDGSSITVNTGTFDTSGNPAAAPTGKSYSDPVFGTKVGDVLMVTNQWGAALGTVTKVGAVGVLSLAAGDPLNINQTAAAAGNIAALKNPGTNVYPATTVSRINIVTYFVQAQPGPDGIIGTADDIPTLMRQVNGQAAIPIADNVTNVQFTYDVYNAAAVAPATPYTAGLQGNAVANMSQIRKVNLQMTVQSQYRTPIGGVQTLTVGTSIAPRDLSFKDRYN